MIIQLPYPPSVNQYYRTVPMRVGGRTINRTLISKSGRDYKRRVKSRMDYRLDEFQDAPLIVMIRFFPRDARVRDIDNPIKPLLDALRDAELFRDDSQIKRLAAEMNEPTAESRKCGGYCIVSVERLCGKHSELFKELMWRCIPSPLETNCKFTMDYKIQ